MSTLTLKTVEALIKNGEKGICCMISLGGWSAEAYRQDDSAILVVRDDGEEIFASISQWQYDHLYRLTSWEETGAQASNDARIVEAAYKWVNENSLDWCRRSLNKSELVAIERPFWN